MTDVTTAARILVVDDNAAALRAMTRTLAREGYEVLGAETGHEALKLVREKRPGLVLLDVTLPDHTAPEVLATIRAEPALDAVSVVLLGALKATRNVPGASLDAGAEGYIARPVNKQELLARVRLHLRQRELTNSLRDGEQRYRAIVEHLPDLVFINRNDRIIFVNEAGVKMLRAASAADILGRSPYEFFHPGAHEVIRKRIAEVRKRPMVAPRREEELVALDGTVIDVEVMATSFRSGDHMDIQVICRDISGRKRLEAEREELLAREQAARRQADEASHYYRSLFESAPGCYLVMTPDEFRIVAVSEAYLRATMTRREEISGRKFFDILPGDPSRPDADGVRNMRASLERVKKTGHADVIPVQCIAIRRPEAQGGGLEDRYWSPVNSPVLGPDGKLAYIIHRIEDVTEYLDYRSEIGQGDDARLQLQSRAEQMEADIILRSREIEETNRRLEESQALLRMASHISRLGAWSIELAEQRLTWSDEVHEIHEVPKDVTPKVDDAIGFYAPEYRGQIRSAFETCVQDGVPYDLELQIVTATGRRVWVRTMGEAVRDESGRIVRAQGAFQDISERKEAEAREYDLRDRLTRMLERIGEGFIALDRDWHINYLNCEAERVLQISRSNVVGRSIWEIFPDAVGSRFQQEYERALRDDVPVTLVEYFAPLELWADVRAYPSREGLALYFRDVTRERSLEEQVRQSQRLESVGQLTGGVAHDFNNLLTVILGNAELLSEQLGGEPRLRPLAEMIAGAAQRGAALTQSLLAFARRQALEPSAVDVNELFSGIQALLRRTLGENIEIQFKPDSGIERAMVDPAQLESALLNLCLNARDAMPGGGRLTVETGYREIDREFANTNLELIPGKYVMVAVSDTGCGIPQADLPRVFEPFFTTKEKGKGTGLGLSMVYGFIKQSGGQLNIYSELGVGTTLRLYLPRASAAEAEATTAVAQELVAGGGETILLVEDDEMVRRYAYRQLVDLGYEVIDAANGPDAMQVLRQRDDIELLFTDIVMPGGMNGKQLADAARKLHPGLQVLFTSGYTENAIVHHGRLDPGVQLLSKPYRRAELAERVRLALSHL